MTAISKSNVASANSIIIERVAFYDIEPLSQLFREVISVLPYYNETAKRSELAKYSSTLLLESVNNDPDSVLVAKVAGKLAGFCLSRDDDGVIWLSWFGVHHSYRRKGIGSALLQRLEETVRDGRAHKIWCDCRTENEASKTLLNDRGYTQLCIVRNHWYGQDFILWEKFVK
jgi:ribosomal protein S18 acetylase RimI-like enzyme